MKTIFVLLTCLTFLHAVKPHPQSASLENALKSLGNVKFVHAVSSERYKAVPLIQNTSCLSNNVIETCDGCKIQGVWVRALEQKQCDTNDTDVCVFVKESSTLTLGKNNVLSLETKLTTTLNNAAAKILKEYMRENCPELVFTTTVLDVAISMSSPYSSPHSCVLQRNETCQHECEMTINALPSDPCDPYSGPTVTDCTLFSDDFEFSELEMSENCWVMNFTVPQPVDLGILNTTWVNGTLFEGRLANQTLVMEFTRASSGGLSTGQIIGIVCSVIGFCCGCLRVYLRHSKDDD